MYNSVGCVKASVDGCGTMDVDNLGGIDSFGITDVVNLVWQT